MNERRGDKYRKRKKNKTKGAGDLESRGKSTLMDKVCRLLGFAYDKHPNKTGWTVQVSFYELKPCEYVICLSEFSDAPDGKNKHSIGNLTPGYLIAPFAERYIDGMTRGELKSTFEETYSNADFTWWSKL